MNISRNQAVIWASVVLGLILLGTFTAAKMTDDKEKSYAEKISDMYNEEFIPVNSNASLFGNKFDLTVQSGKTKNVYQFQIDDEQIEGNYYVENVNLELNKIIEDVSDSFAMTKASTPKYDQPISAQEAEIEAIEVLLITKKTLKETKAKEIAEKLKAVAGDVPIVLEVIAVENEADYNGVTYEIENYFERSSVTKSSFESLDYKDQTFEF